MIWSEESGGLDFHAGIVRANKRQVNVPLGDKPWKTSSICSGNLMAQIGV
jgi:hypothetical protein